jgi:transcriptional regulator GlxA family with amidase domain
MDQRVLIVVRLIQKDLSRPLTLKEMAQAVGLSSSHLRSLQSGHWNDASAVSEKITTERSTEAFRNHLLEHQRDFGKGWHQ